MGGFALVQRLRLRWISCAFFDFFIFFSHNQTTYYQTPITVCQPIRIRLIFQLFIFIFHALLANCDFSSSDAFALWSLSANIYLTFLLSSSLVIAFLFYRLLNKFYWLETQLCFVYLCELRYTFINWIFLTDCCCVASLYFDSFFLFHFFYYLLPIK